MHYLHFQWSETVFRNGVHLSRLITTRPVTTGYSGAVKIFFVLLPQFLCAQKNLFETYNKNLASLKTYSPLHTLKPGYGPGYDADATFLGL